MAETAQQTRKPGTGYMKPNATDNPKAPNWRGHFTALDGTQWQISGWDKEWPDGRKMSLQVQVPYVKPAPRVEQASAPAPGTAGSVNQADDVPF